MILTGDSLTVLKTLDAESVHCCVTSPPYWGLRDYGVKGQIGLEATPEAYVARMVEVFREVRRVLRSDGTLWLNLGDSYNSQPGQRKSTDKHGTKQATNIGSNEIGSRDCPGLKPKDLIGIPWRVAFALQADGWWLRSEIIWHKPNPMPESVRSRPTKAHEQIFLLAKSARYFYDAKAIAEPATTIGDTRHLRADSASFHARPDNGSRARTGKIQASTRNRRTVWTVASRAFKGAHFATFPPKLIEPCILAGCPAGGVVLDPFSGAGTTAMVAESLGRRAIGIDLNPAYSEMAHARLAKAAA